MKLFIIIFSVLIAVAIIILAVVGLSNALCPNGMDDWTRSGCGHTQQEINQHNCEKIGGTYFYGGFLSAGTCVK